MACAEPAKRGSQLAWPLRDRFPLPLLILGFCGLYFLAAKLGVATSLPPEGIVIIWLPNAIVLAALLVADRKTWWAFFAATVATEVAADFPDYPLWAAAGYGVVNFAQGALAALLLSRSGRWPDTHTNAFIRFLIVGPLVACGVTALLGAAIYKIGAPEVSYMHYWRVFWFGDALGMVLIGTALLSFGRMPRSLSWGRAKRLLEALALATLLLATSVWAFYSGPDVPRVYLVFPLLLWAAVRFGAHGASFVVPSTIALAIASAAGGVGPFAGLSTIDTVIALQGLSLVVALSTFFLAFTIEDFREAASGLHAEVARHERTEEKLANANARLESSNRHLDDQVAQRTMSLQHALAHNQTLLNEVHHRVKNSLQMVSALVTLQGRSTTAQELGQKITGQVSAIAATYDVIHRMESVETADLSQVVPEICSDILGSTGGWLR